MSREHTTTEVDAATGQAVPPIQGVAGKVWAALTDQPATTSQIVKTAGVSPSATAKALAALEAAGLAARAPGRGAGRSRIPDTWTANTPTTNETTAPQIITGVETGTQARSDNDAATTGTTPEEPDTDQTDASPDTAISDTSETTGNIPPDKADDGHGDSAASGGREPSPESPAGGQQTPQPATPPGADSSDLSDHSDHKAPDDSDQDSTIPSGMDPTGTGGAQLPGRLGKGQLRAMVAAQLAAHLDRDFTPTELHHILDRSSGAITSALDTLVQQGEAVQTRDHPLAYAHPTATVDLARPVTRRTARRTDGRRARATEGSAGLVDRALDAYRRERDLDAAHPDQPGWGQYAIQAATNLATILAVPAEEIELDAEPYGQHEAWARLTVVALIPSGLPAAPAGAQTDNPCTTSTSPPNGDADIAACDPAGGGRVVFVAPWGEPGRILAVTGCPSCHRPVPTVRISRLAELGVLLAHDGEVHGLGLEPAAEIDGYPTHLPDCAHATS